MRRKIKGRPEHKLANLSLDTAQLLRLVQGQDVVEDRVRWDGLEVLGELVNVLVRELNLSSGLQAEVILRCVWETWNRSL